VHLKIHQNSKDWNFVRTFSIASVIDYSVIFDEIRVANYTGDPGGIKWHLIFTTGLFFFFLVF